MFNKVLIANRGEIAVRIIRACRELGLRTVAVCSEADRDALHAQIADETICIGPAPSKDSYLNIPNILSACTLTGAGAVHPGFGFLSENAAFAAACARCGIRFIGPSAEAIERMGDKSTAKQTMQASGVPVIPGSDGIIANLEQAKTVAEEIGYPVLIKASAGGGGRGIRLVESENELENALATAKEEALRFFSDDRVYMEKFVIRPRHVEMQIMADSQGNVVWLGERDCSMQRRNQKVLEESPCPSKLMTPDLRQRMGEAAVAAARAVDYENAGTIEFLLDARGDFYFMEMNTRIQVEHPVTEEVTGIDLVKTQITVAMGRPLPFRQEDVQIRGHAIECRINAETPSLDFRPSPGTLTGLYLPGGPGIRVDSAIYAGYTIPPYYDNMMAKLIAFAPTREEAIAKMRWALAEFIVDGVDTNIDFQLEILRDPDFVLGEYDIASLGRILEHKSSGK
ncbi:MAG: acetyl-CoA carboxylase biotin carboxylase subunit [Oscillospiraceae bacterium]